LSGAGGDATINAEIDWERLSYRIKSAFIISSRFWEKGTGFK